MQFNSFNQKLRAHIEDMCNGATHLFEVDLDKDQLWDLYLDSFPAGTNEIFRVRRSEDCSGCRHFIKNFGNVVAIKNGKMTTIWDFDAESDMYQPVIDTLSAFVKEHRVTNVYYTDTARIGVKPNIEITPTGAITWNHLSVTLPDSMVTRNMNKGEYQDGFRATRDVFARSLSEISIYSIEVVQEIIAQGTLYKGEEWAGMIDAFLKYKTSYDAIRNNKARELFLWEQSVKAGPAVGRIINHAIGVLLSDLSQGMDLETAVRRYEKVVAPQNYKRPKPIFTPEMLRDAERTVLKLGYMDSLPRRYAVAGDVPPHHILFGKRPAPKPELKTGGIFTEMMADAVSRQAKKAPAAAMSSIEPISIERFIDRVLPTAKQIELYLENRHAGNLVSLIAAQNPDSPSMFKWKNSFCWSYADNVTDSIRENVKAAGGDVEGVLRFSIQWNDSDQFNGNDFDAHCKLPNGGHIYFSDKHDRPSNGILDKDIIHPEMGKTAIENITWPSKSRMPAGDYQFYVHCYSERGGQDGFKAEIAFDGKSYFFEYPHFVAEKDSVYIATVTLDHSGNFSIRVNPQIAMKSRDLWGLNSNEFVPVNMMMYSPNHWEDEGIGHRHLFFMLEGCRNPETLNGFYNEYLNNDLMKHRQVFEALSSKMKVPCSDDQLSGVGFSMTKRDSVVVRVTGVTQRQFRVEF